MDPIAVEACYFLWRQSVQPVWQWVIAVRKGEKLIEFVNYAFKFPSFQMVWMKTGSERR